MNEQTTIMTRTKSNPSQYYTCQIDERGNIWATDRRGGEQCIGVTGEQYQALQDELQDSESNLAEALDKAEKYYNILLEHELIEPVLTSDEQMENMAKEMQELKGLIALLLEEKTQNTNITQDATQEVKDD